MTAVLDPMDLFDDDDERIIESVPVERMFREPTFSRPVDQPSIKRMVGGWDDDLCDVLVLSLRDDGYYCILDGCHRWSAARLRHIPELMARVLRDLTPEREATLYWGLNKNRRRMMPMDIFRARLVARDATALDLVEAVESAGFQIAVYGKGSGRIDAIASLEGMQATIDNTGVFEVLNIIRDAWGIGERRRAVCAPMLEGLGQFWLRFSKEPKFKRGRLVDRLAITGPDAVLASSNSYRLTRRQGMSASSATGRAVLDLFNASLRPPSRLPEWQERVLGDLGRQRIVDGKYKRQSR